MGCVMRAGFQGLGSMFSQQIKRLLITSKALMPFQHISLTPSSFEAHDLSWYQEHRP